MATIMHEILGEVECVASARSRSIRLSVKPSGAVRLSYPRQAGQRRALSFLESRVEWVEATRRKIAARQAELPHISRTEVERLRDTARRTLPDKTRQLAARLGFDCGRVTIRAARTKWGCCTSENNLSLSLFLSMLPDHLQEYVIIHELCHTLHHNHSAAFHALVDRCVEGKEKLLDRELRSYRIPVIDE